jgi:hypothetical protein
MPVILSPNDYAAWMNLDERDAKKLAYSSLEPHASADVPGKHNRE